MRRDPKPKMQLFAPLLERILDDPVDEFLDSGGGTENLRNKKSSVSEKKINDNFKSKTFLYTSADIPPRFCSSVMMTPGLEKIEKHVKCFHRNFFTDTLLDCVTSDLFGGKFWKKISLRRN